MEPTKKTVSQGFGDDVERVAKKLGLDKLAKSVMQVVGVEDCGCGARRDALNQLFPYKNNEQDEAGQTG